jgi:hypothetical protein
MPHDFRLSFAVLFFSNLFRISDFEFRILGPFCAAVDSRARIDNHTLRNHSLTGRLVNWLTGKNEDGFHQVAD